VIPWHGPFRYMLHDRGFHSEDAVTRRGGLRVNGGFTAEADGDRTRVWHYERYLLPWPVAGFKPLVTAYVRWTQRREMRDVKALIERDGLPAPASWSGTHRLSCVRRRSGQPNAPPWTAVLEPRVGRVKAPADAATGSASARRTAARRRHFRSRRPRCGPPARDTARLPPSEW
jgi:hypothetical protein